MFSEILFFTFWFGVMTLSEGFISVNFTVFHTVDSVKYTSLTGTPLDLISEIECSRQCEHTQCCAASYHKSLQQCYLHKSCFGETELVTGWKILKKDIQLKMIYIAQKKSWDDAQAHCASFGGRLAIVTTAEKHDLIMTYNHGTNSAWVGASDRDVEGTWVWHNPTQPVLLNYWAPSRPDNNVGIQHCMGYLAHVGFIWDDRDCSDLNDFICDIPYQ